MKIKKGKPKSKTPNSTFLIGLFIVCLVTLASFFISYHLKKSALKTEAPKQINTYQNKYDTLSKLIPQEQISEFKNKLGDPIFINYSKDNSQKEYIFIDKLFYLQAITDNRDKVISFAITSRTNDFNFPFNASSDTAYLSKTTFAQAVNPQSFGEMNPVCFFMMGNTAASYYFEQYYFGRPANYQTFLWGYNQAGYTSPGAMDLIANLGQNPKTYSNQKITSKNQNIITIDCKIVPDNLREKMVINTYIISEVDYSTLQFGLGVDVNLVSTYKE